MDTTESEVMHAATIWKSMSEAQRLDAAAAFWDDDQSIAEQAEVVGVLARQLNFRPKSIVALPLEKRARMLARMGKVSDLVAGRLLVSYHLAKQRSLMGAFLDSLGIGHEEGLISDDDVEGAGRGARGGGGGSVVRCQPARGRHALFLDAPAAGWWRAGARCARRWRRDRRQPRHWNPAAKAPSPLEA